MSTHIDNLQVWTFDSSPGDDWTADEEFYRAADVRALATQMEMDLRAQIATELRALADAPIDAEDSTARVIQTVIREGYSRAAELVEQNTYGATA